MKFRNLGRADVAISQICLGSMTWGTQNTEQEGHEQMDYAVAHGINFIDTAEIYPTTPMSAEKIGRTEQIIGTWFRNSGQRDKIILGSKVPGVGMQWVQEGIPITPEKIRTSIHGSLKRLQTDYIDLYQLHWPNRGSYHFRQAWSYDPSDQNLQKTRDEIIAILTEMQSLIDAGKIRHIGLSNESCWGTSQFLQIAEEHNLPRVVSIQNEYSLMHRSFDLDLAELSHNENVGLLAYSPLSAGILTGKYNHGKIPANSRRSMNSDLYGRYTEHSIPAMHAYVEVAHKHSLDPSQMALAFCMTRPFMASVIIGATSINQLKTNVAAVNVELNAEVMDDILKVHRTYPAPV